MTVGAFVIKAPTVASKDGPDASATPRSNGPTANTPDRATKAKRAEETHPDTLAYATPQRLNVGGTITVREATIPMVLVRGPLEVATDATPLQVDSARKWRAMCR